MGNKDGAYEADIQHALSEVFRLLTPFVCAEPCRGYADHIVYINDETLTPWIHRTLQNQSDQIMVACRYYQYEDNLCHIQYPPIACAGKKCSRYQQLQQTREDLKPSFSPGIHLVEVKSNHDNVHRFGHQLPHYCLFADYSWLTIEDHDPPAWLPPFVGVIQYHDGTISIEGEATKIDRAPRLDKTIIQKAHPAIKKIQNTATFLAFLRTWFINSVFNDGQGNYIIEMPHLKDLITLTRKTGTQRQLTPTTLTEFTDHRDES
ncbi:MAG: hypothetical protein ACP5FL_06615 [Thermoplasmatota archaeon]